MGSLISSIDDATLAAVRAEYDASAHAYDGRWSRYVRRTTEAATRHLAARRGEHVIDIGCGTGELLASVARDEPGVRITGIDVSQNMLRVARAKAPNAKLVVGSALCVPFADGTFDAAASVSALHFTSDPDRALAEMLRLLRPGGRLVVVDWCRDYLAMNVLDKLTKRRTAAHGQTWVARQLAESLRAAGGAAVEVRHFRCGLLWGLMAATARK